MTARKILFWIHLTAGCGAGAVVLIMSVTGVLLAYERQILTWADRPLRSRPSPADSQRLPFDRMMREVCAENAGQPSQITLRSDPGAPAEVAFGRDRVVLVDVYSGRVVGESSRSARMFLQAAENWHRWLGAPVAQRPAGRAVTGASNLAFLILVVSGPFLWLPRKWSWQGVKSGACFRRGLQGRARDFNWHNAIGIWCALPLCVIVLSGVVMSYSWANGLVYRLTGSEIPVPGNNARPGNETALQGEPRRRANGASRDGKSERPSAQTNSLFIGLDRLWKRAEQQVPGWQTVSLRLPQGGRGPLTFTINTGSGGRPDQRSQLMLDPRSGEVIRWEPFSSYNTGRRVRSWLRFLHTGEAGGIAGQTVAAIASLGAAMLVWTGISLAFRRWRRWKTRDRAPSTLPEKLEMATRA